MEGKVTVNCDLYHKHRKFARSGVGAPSLDMQAQLSPFTLQIFNVSLWHIIPVPLPARKRLELGASRTSFRNPPRERPVQLVSDQDR